MIVRIIVGQQVQLAPSAAGSAAPAHGWGRNGGSRRMHLSAEACCFPVSLAVRLPPPLAAPHRQCHPHLPAVSPTHLNFRGGSQAIAKKHCSVLQGWRCAEQCTAGGSDEPLETNAMTFLRTKAGKAVAPQLRRAGTRMYRPQEHAARCLHIKAQASQAVRLYLIQIPQLYSASCARSCL